MSDVIEPQASEETALAIIPASAVSTIVAADENDILGKLKEELKGFKGDISTPKGRKEIASKAAKVATAKMDLIRLGKSLTENWRKSTAAVNAECKLIEERMDALKEQVRAPLTAWENIEKERVAANEARLAAMERTASFLVVDPSSDAIRGRIDYLNELHSQAWDHDFTAKAADIHKEISDKLRAAHAAAVKREEEAAELARLRAEKEERDRQEAERQRQEREAEIARQAAEQARLDAEAKAEAERRAEAERVAAEERRLQEEARQAEDRAAKAERDRLEAERRAKEAADQAVRDRIAAEEQRKRDLAEAEVRAERQRLDAIEAERKRAADELAAQQAEADRRAADKAHRAAINRAAMEDLVKAGLSEQAARAAVTAIASGNVRNFFAKY